MKYVLALTALSASAVPMAAIAQTSVNIAETAPVVTLTVTESVEGTPDIAVVGTGVQTRAQTAQAAMQDNAAKTEKLIAALGRAGIAKKDIQTSGINLNAQYDYNNRDGEPAGPRFIGYEASNQLSVKLRDIKKVGASLDAMVAAGATNINGPSFSIDDPSTLIVQARSQALRSAKAQAEFYAQAAGYRSVRLVSISESSNGSMPPPPAPPMMSTRFKADAAPITPVEPGQVSMSATLTVQYALDR
ncbi:hypothetical protein J3E64_000497 [Sphingobium sp. OAS761]|uniref:SIMPL domain-containing protein n=1 Tax=Sphingobium sp. OAS761 TaxID=2817901 RepID=UPI00209FF659|nr:SIMPL domain-containing protein [Sphingobium sp. OAS761]MCP1468830.1 hypothetical protein [Sphingobium sp. OAS761]